VLVGFDTADDAGVFRLGPDQALVQTLDFFTPVVDDPHTYGAIAAANSLSDVYAMGGRPITAMAIACFPEKGADPAILAAIMLGGAGKLLEAGVALLGGHTVSDNEIKFGYSVTGLVHPSRVLANSTAQPGDVLVLTKPLGIGLVTSGIKFGLSSPAAIDQAIRLMTTLNRTACEIMTKHAVHAATDITGNGLLGHAWEMACGSRVTLRFDSQRIPYIEEAWKLAEGGLSPRTIKTTAELIGTDLHCPAALPEPLRKILLDPQTSGGLLISVAERDHDAMLAKLISAGVPAVAVGAVEARGEYRLIVE
jgi:selenide, water dikinase